MKKKFMAGLAIGLLMVGMSGLVQATPILWSTGNYSQTGIGDEGSTLYDKLNIYGLSGSIDLKSNSSAVVLVDNLEWIVGWNAYTIHDSLPYQASLDFTIGSVTKSITQNYFAHIGYSDTLHMDDSDIYSFNLGQTGIFDVQVTGLTLENAGGLMTGKLWAKISFHDNPLHDSQAPVPETTTMFLFGIGLVGLAGVIRKKKA
jgi:hypothetical protein